MRGYLALLAFQLRTSFALALQYRLDFVLEGFVEVFWTVTALVPLFVIYDARETVAGWNFGESLMVVGCFTLLQAVLEGVISPCMTLVVEQIRKGTFDFVLLKPRDAQFLVSTARVQPWRAVNLVTAAVLFVVGFAELGRTPSWLDFAFAAALLLAGIAILYSLWTIAAAIAFWVVKIDNLTHLFNSIFDAARWPASVFRGFLRVLFTFVIPLAVMTTFPAQALLGRAGAIEIFGGLGTAAVALAVSRALWVRAIGRYTSASS